MAWCSDQTLGPTLREALQSQSLEELAVRARKPDARGAEYGYAYVRRVALQAVDRAQNHPGLILAMAVRCVLAHGN